MSTKYKGLSVTFENNVSEEYAQDLVKAISAFRGVITVTPIESNLCEDELVKARTIKMVQGDLIKLMKSWWDK